MRKYSIFGVVLFTSLFFIRCKTASDMEKLEKQISLALQAEQGRFAVAFKDVQTGETLEYHAHDSFHAASTMKTPVMIELFRQAATGKFSMDDSVVVHNQFKSIVDGSSFSLDSADDSEQDLYRHIGEKRSIRQLLYNMITMSSNLATNMLIDSVGADHIMTTMQDLGAKEMKVLRGVEDQKAFDKGLNNTTTAHDLMLLFDKMARGELVSPTASNEMMQVLREQHFNEIIPALLPNTVKVAHKTGSITGVQHDSGIVIMPDGRKYVLVILSDQLKDVPAAIKAMAGVSKMVYDYMLQKGSPQ